MPVGAIIGAVGSVAGAAISANAAKKAAKQQSSSAERAREDLRRYQEEIRGLTEQNLLPFVPAGQGAMASLAQLYGIDPATGEATGEAFAPGALEAFRRSPDYQFALQEGLGAVERSNAGRGMLRSGNTLRDLTNFGQGLATQTFGNYRGALENLARIGLGAAGSAVSGAIGAGGQAASGLSNAALHAGTAQASGTVGAANALSGALGNIGNYAMLSQLMKPTASAYAPSGALAPYASSNPMGYSSTLPGGVGAFPY